MRSLSRQRDRAIDLSLTDFSHSERSKIKWGNSLVWKHRETRHFNQGNFWDEITTNLFIYSSEFM